MTIKRLQPYAYKYPPIWQVRVGDRMIDDSDVLDIQGLGVSLDVLTPTTFQTRTLRLVLSNASRRYTLLADTNAFTEAGYDSKGSRAPVEIHVGYLVDGQPETELLFKGLVTNSQHEGSEERVVLSVSDESQLLNRNTIADFGIQRYMTLQKDRATQNGRYVIPDILLEVSEDSLSGTSGSSPLVVHDALETEGDLNPLNVAVEDAWLESEGDFLLDDPEVSFKSPFRWKQMKPLVEDLLQAHGVTDFIVDVPKVALSQPFFETLGRVGYDVIQTQPADVSNPWTWQGHVTDVKYQSSTGDYFFLYGHRRSNVNPKLIHRNALGISRVLVEGDADMEWWKLNISADDPLTIEILGTDVPSSPLQPTLGAYNAAETGNGVKVWRVVFSQSDDRYVVQTPLAVIRSSADALSPQLAQGYWFGYTPDGGNNNERQSHRPDSRKNFLGDNAYIYVRNNDVGVARLNTVLVSFARDGNFNETGIDFWIEGSTLYAGCTWMQGDSSRLKVVSRSIS